jgi:Do/DeqQ family serine protease
MQPTIPQPVPGYRRALWLFALLLAAINQHACALGPTAAASGSARPLAAEPEGDVPTGNSTPVVAPGQPLPSLAPMLERVMPGVVNIATRSEVLVRSPLLSDPFFSLFFDVPERLTRKQAQSLGSGVIVDARRGYILTNRHVIEEADEVNVTLHDGRELSARYVGSDPRSDLAIIAIEPESLVAVPLGRSDRLRVGDFVVAIGSPFGLRQTVTSGIVSGLGRSGLGLEGYEDFIQTDASINPGNSGGALVDLRGELVGINTAILAPGGGNVGIGFAIPVDAVKRVMQQLLKYGEVRQGLLGADFQDLDAQLASAFGLGHPYGAVVTRVVPGTPAAGALRQGDVITGLNGREVRDAGALRRDLSLIAPEEGIGVTGVRQGQPFEVSIELVDPYSKRRDGERLSPYLAGAVLAETLATDDRGRTVTVVEVIRVEPGSVARRAGLRRGDYVLGANRWGVASLDDLAQALAARRGGMLLRLQRGEKRLSLAVE